MAAKAELYGHFMAQIARVNRTAPKGRAPKLYNYHKLVTSPFDRPNQAIPTRQLPLALKSQAYAASGIPSTPQTTPFRMDIPLPSVLTRHIHLPSPTLSSASALGKITGFRMEITGRRGSRSSTQRFAYGRLGTTDMNSYVDFGKSYFVHKKGVTGVKVWVGYGR
ncbi:hypothetical protein DFS34DRAFT_650667 [Phlyctochytrium arcticum]|nr:hypothetical protein DFS34DRAFT_650667 [Phlyctochytrium arcticum]